MSLTTDLQAFKEQFLTNVPEETAQVMGKATMALAESGIVDHSLTVGQQAPEVKLPNATGATVHIQELLKSGPVVLSFYRGQWCPYCNLELRALQQIVPQIQALGANLVAVSPQTPDNSLSTVEKNELTYEVLSDVGNQIARAYGLVFELPEHLRPIYTSFGIDVPAHNGDSSFELPIAATYVIATDGTISHAFIDADYTQRLDPEAILAALKDLG